MHEVFDYKKSDDIDQGTTMEHELRALMHVLRHNLDEKSDAERRQQLFRVQGREHYLHLIFSIQLQRQDQQVRPRLRVHLLVKFSSLLK